MIHMSCLGIGVWRLRQMSKEILLSDDFGCPLGELRKRQTIPMYYLWKTLCPPKTNRENEPSKIWGSSTREEHQFTNAAKRNGKENERSRIWVSSRRPGTASEECFSKTISRFQDWENANHGDHEADWNRHRTWKTLKNRMSDNHKQRNQKPNKSTHRSGRSWLVNDLKGVKTFRG